MTGLEKQLANINRFFDKPVGQQFFLDTCTILNPVQVEDGHSGHTIEDDEVLTDISCLIERAGKEANAEVDAVNAGNTCRLHLKLDENQALLLDQHSKIRVAARGLNPEMVFEQPVKDKDSMGQVVLVSAICTSGMRRPGSR